MLDMLITDPEEFVEAARKNSLTPHTEIKKAWQRGFNYDNTLNTDTQEYVRIALSHKHFPRILPAIGIFKVFVIAAAFVGGWYGINFIMHDPSNTEKAPEFVKFLLPIILGALLSSFVALMIDFEIDTLKLMVVKPRPNKTFDNPLYGQIRYDYKTGYIPAIYGSSLESYSKLLREARLNLKECYLDGLNGYSFGKEPKNLYELDGYLTLIGFIACKKEIPLALEVATNPDDIIEKDVVKKAIDAVIKFTALSIEPAYEAFKFEQVGDIERSKNQSKMIADQIDADFKRATEHNDDHEPINL